MNKSELVRKLKAESGKTTKDFADALSITESYFNNKLHRNSWTVDDLVTLIHFCGKEIYIVDEGFRI